MGVVIYDLPDDNDISFYYFPEYQNATREFLTNMIEWFGDNFLFGLAFRAWLSVGATIILIVHILILSQKSLRASSINVIMIGIALTDITFMLFNIFRYFGLIIDGSFDSCSPIVHLYSLYFFMGFSALSDMSRRASSWLVIAMALIRAIVIKFATNSKYQCLTISKSGWISILIAVLLASPITIMEWFRYQFNEVDESQYLEDCEPAERVNNYTFPVFNMSTSGFFESYDELPLKLYYLSEALLSKFLPCLISPIVTIVLIREIQTSKRKKSSAMRSNYKQDSNNRTTKLVSFMSFSFLVIHFPQGVAYTSQIFIAEQLGATILLTYFMSIFTILYILNAASHLILCFYLSNQYRNMLIYFIKLPSLITVTIHIKSSVSDMPMNHNINNIRSMTHSQVSNVY